MILSLPTSKEKSWLCSFSSAGDIMAYRPVPITYALRESKPGVCPVCRYDYASDPWNECHCTAPHPDDEAEMVKAYALSAAHRDAKLTADALDAGRRMSATIQRQPRQGNVV